MLRSLTATFCLILVFTSCSSYTSTLQQSPGRVDEGVTITALRGISRAQTAYLVANGQYGTFEQLSTGGFLDSRFNTDHPKIFGYTLTMTTTPSSGGSTEPSYSCNADPTDTASSKGRHFYMDTGGVIHVNATQPATENDERLQQ